MVTVLPEAVATCLLLEDQAIPETHYAVISPYCKQPGGCKGQCTHRKLGVYKGAMRLLTISSMPNTHGPAMRRGCDRLSIRCPGGGFNRGGMLGENSLQHIGGGSIPDNRPFIQPGRNHL